jgi:hypothetical protein
MTLTSVPTVPNPYPYFRVPFVRAPLARVWPCADRDAFRVAFTKGFEVLDSLRL